MQIRSTVCASPSRDGSAFITLDRSLDGANQCSRGGCLASHLTMQGSTISGKSLIRCRFVSAIVGITIILINRQNSTKGLEQNRQLPAGNIQKPAKSLRKALKSLQETGTVLDARFLNPQPRSGNYLQKVQSPPEGNLPKGRYV